MTEDKLCETKYLENTLKYLRDIFPEFEDFEFSILSTQYGDVNPVMSNPDKRNVLIWISDEFGHQPDNLSQTFDFVYKSYIKQGGVISSRFHWAM